MDENGGVAYGLPLHKSVVVRCILYLANKHRVARKVRCCPLHINLTDEHRVARKVRCCPLRINLADEHRVAKKSVVVRCI